MEETKRIRSLFFQFLKFGCVTFGGGWSIVAQIRRVYVEERQLITDEELLDLTSVGRSLPGLMVGNVTMLFGCRCAGVLGGLACVLGLCLPPMALLCGITLCYTAFRDSYWVAAAMEAIRAAVVPIILSAALPMIRGVSRGRASLLIICAAFAAYLMGLGSIWLILGGAVCGLLMGRREQREEERK